MKKYVAKLPKYITLRWTKCLSHQNLNSNDKCNYLY